VALVSGEWLDKEVPSYFVLGAPQHLGHNSQQHRLKTKVGLYTPELTQTVKSVRCDDEVCLSPSLYFELRQKVSNGTFSVRFSRG